MFLCGKAAEDTLFDEKIMNKKERDIVFRPKNTKITLQMTPVCRIFLWLKRIIVENNKGKKGVNIENSEQ